MLSCWDRRLSIYSHALTELNPIYTPEHCRSSSLCHRHVHGSPYPDSSSWVSAIQSSSQRGHFKDALRLFVCKNRYSFPLNNFVISAALKACARLNSPIIGASMHAQIHKLGHVSDLFVGTALLGLYSRVGEMENAQKLFDQMPMRNVVSWNSLLSGYLRAGNLVVAQNIFNRIPVKDAVSWNAIIAGYAKAGHMCRAELLFHQMPVTNAASWNSLISGYVICGDMAAARKLFDEMPVRSDITFVEMISGYSERGAIESATQLFDQMENKSLLSWNAIIACYVQNDRPKEALLLFCKMHDLIPTLRPDGMTFASVLSACGQLGDFKFGAWVESRMNEIGIELDDHLGTALLNLYAKCGSMEKAYKLFHCLRKRDVVSYSAMIMGCGINSRVLDATCLFEEMVKEKISPNDVTFTGLLTAYNHAGMVDEGCRCFASMSVSYGVLPNADHCAIMVDLLGRAGRLEEALGLIRTMSMKAHVGVWGALLLACRIHCNIRLGEVAARHCIALQNEESGYNILLANIYAALGRWDDVERLRKSEVEKGLDKVPGCSWLNDG